MRQLLTSSAFHFNSRLYAKETPAKCVIGKHPASPPWTRVTAKLQCKNSILPCGGFHAKVDLDFDADVVGPGR
jgi:hypothetical protein